MLRYFHEGEIEQDPEPKNKVYMYEQDGDSDRHRRQEQDGYFPNVSCHATQSSLANSGTMYI